MTSSVFVYGTLKRGQCRQRLWPVAPISVQIGWVAGALYDRSDYPAMTAGDDRVVGERWQFDRNDLQAVLDRLDQIEGTNQPGRKDLYRRVVEEVYSPDGHSLGLAWTYLYCRDPQGDGFVRIQPDQKGAVRWP